MENSNPSQTDNQEKSLHNTQEPEITFMDEDFQLLDFEDNGRTCGDRNPWLDQLPSTGNESEKLKEEIEQIIQAAESAKQAALLDEGNILLPPTFADNVQPIETVDTTHEESEKIKDVEEKDPVVEYSNKGEKLSKEEEEGQRNEHGAIEDKPPQNVSLWNRIFTSAPIQVAKRVANEMIIPISVFSIVSYVTLQLSDI